MWLRLRGNLGATQGQLRGNSGAENQGANSYEARGQVIRA
jgi:hypothetical protein